MSGKSTGNTVTRLNEFNVIASGLNSQRHIF